MGHLRLWVAAARGAALGQAVDAASLGTPPAPLRAALCDKPFDTQIYHGTHQTRRYEHEATVVEWASGRADGAAELCGRQDPGAG